MNNKTLILPFITKTVNQQENLSYPAELACIVCAAESERKKPGLLRDAQEKIVFISKIYYPMWVLSAENECVIIDGLSAPAHEFAFEEPTQTAVFAEELKKNSVTPQKFLEALQTQAKATKEFTSTVNLVFPALVDDKELLGFLLEYFKTGTVQDSNQQQTPMLPPETDAKAASETRQALVNSLRTMQADAKGLTYALSALKEELEFQTNAASNEIERLEEKRDLEIAAIKPVVDKNVKKITQKQTKVLASLQKSLDRKVVVLEKKRETYMLRLQVAEQRKDAVQKRVDAAKKKKTSSKSSSGSFALQKYGREVENKKKEIKAVSEELEKFRKEAENSLKLNNAEFKNLIAQEESQLTQLNNAYNAKTSQTQKQIDEMRLQAAAINSRLENIVDELKRSCNVLRSQVEIDWKLDDPEEPILAQLPVYLVKYVKAQEERYSLFSPIALSEGVGVLVGLKKMFAINPEPKLKTLTNPASKKLQETLSACVLEKIRADAGFRVRVNELCRGSNLLDLNSFGQTLNEGLDEIEKKGWLSREEASTICRRVMGDFA
jgi:hypothetical protein